MQYDTGGFDIKAPGCRESEIGTVTLRLVPATTTVTVNGYASLSLNLRGSPKTKRWSLEALYRPCLHTQSVRKRVGHGCCTYLDDFSIAS